MAKSPKQSEPVGRLLLTRAEAARALGVSERTITWLRETRQLQAVRVGHACMFTPEALQQFIKRATE